MLITAEAAGLAAFSLACAWIVTMAQRRWIHYLLPLLITAVGGCAQEQRGEIEILPVVREIKTADELTKALSSPQAVIHVDVDWSTDAIAARRVISAFRELAVNDPALDGVAFYRLDLTDPNAGPYQAAQAWLRSGSGYRSLMHGYGSLVWVRDGKEVADAARCAEETPANLLKISRESFPSRLPGG